MSDEENPQEKPIALPNDASRSLGGANRSLNSADRIEEKIIVKMQAPEPWPAPPPEKPRDDKGSKND
jgi:hypothetical protein